MELTQDQLLKIQLVEYKEQPYDSLRCAKALANVLTMFDTLRTRLAALEQENTRLYEFVERIAQAVSSLDAGSQDKGMAEQAPCYWRGYSYNRAGYYQPDKHPYSTRHRDASEYHAIHLVRDNHCAVVRIEVDGRWIELIRTPCDGPFSHIIEPSGIQECVDKHVSQVDARTL